MRKATRVVAVLLVLLFAMPLMVRAERGVASFYGGKFHGRKTASGEVFDKNQLTAAHRTLPFGTRLKVTNLQNSRQVVVRINDRGPFIRGRIIDLSERAAREIGMIGAGLATVDIQTLRKDANVRLWRTVSPNRSITRSTPGRAARPALGPGNSPTPALIVPQVLRAKVSVVRRPSSGRFHLQFGSHLSRPRALRQAMAYREIGIPVIVLETPRSIRQWVAVYKVASRDTFAASQCQRKAAAWKIIGASTPKIIAVRAP